MVKAETNGSKLVGAGLATIGSVGAGAGAGIVSGSFLEAYARNPAQGDVSFRYATIGFASTEAVGSLGLMTALPISFIQQK